MVIWWTPVLAKSFVNKKSGDIPLRIDYASWVGWRDGPACPTPGTATIKVNVTATPVGGGAPFVVGEQTFPGTAPSTPGLQPDGAVDYVIADGTLPLGQDYVLDITGTCEVVFVGSGTGAGAFADTSSVESCLVQPSPLDENTPRLGICCLTKSNRIVQIAERGDQRAAYYLISNNDPKFAITIDLESSGLQIANFPDGFSTTDLQIAYDAGAGSISNPIPGTDAFIGVFEDDIPANGIVLNPGDPGAIDPLKITQTDITLAPFESRMVCIVTRSNGMCSDGSCSLRNLKVTGLFADGTSALACATSAHVVQAGAPRQTPRCLYTDSLKVGVNDFAVFSRGHFGSSRALIPHAETHFGGNVPPNFQPFGPDQGATELRGANMPSGLGPFPDQASDTISEQPFLVDSFFDITYEIFIHPPGFPTPTINRTTIIGLDTLPVGTQFDAPVVAIQPEAPAGVLIVDAFFDIGTSQAQLLDTTSFDPQVIYDGPISGLQAFVNQNANIVMPPGICRSIGKEGSTGTKFSVLGPHKRTFALGKKDRAEFFGVDIPIANGQDQQPSPWQATRQGLGAQPQAASGTDQVPIELVALELQSVDPQQVGIFGKKNLVRDFHSWVCVSCPGGLNTADTPFLVRRINKTGQPGIKKDFNKAKSFKKIELGQTGTGFITLRNKGKGPVSFQLPATLPAPFSWASAPSGIHTLFAKETLMIAVAYTPVGVTGKNKGKDKVTAEVMRSDKLKPLKLKLKGDWVRVP